MVVAEYKVILSDGVAGVAAQVLLVLLLPIAFLVMENLVALVELVLLQAVLLTTQAGVVVDLIMRTKHIVLVVLGVLEVGVLEVLLRTLELE
jgi:hypothetical protein